MGSGGWDRVEVAIAVPAPPPIMWADAVGAGRRDGGAKHWAVYYDEVKMLVLRSSVPVRSNATEPGKTAGERSLNWWQDRLMFIGLNPEFTHPIWTWDTTGS